MAGNYTWTMSRGFRSTSGAGLSGSYIVVGSAEQAINANFAAAGVGVASAAAWTPGGTSSGNLVAIAILANQACTIKTNSNTTPQDTINLQANVPYNWDAQNGFAYPFAGAVTGFFVTNTNALNLRYNILTY